MKKLMVYLMVLALAMGAFGFTGCGKDSEPATEALDETTDLPDETEDATDETTQETEEIQEKPEDVDAEFGDVDGEEVDPELNIEDEVGDE